MEEAIRQQPAGKGRHFTAKLAALLVLALLLAACRLTDHSEQEPGAISPKDLQIPASGFQDAGQARVPEITFDSTELHLGTIPEGMQVEKVFRFTNTGVVDLVLTDVRGSCGCTVAKDWPRMPVAPGASGTIGVTFNSTGRPGVQHKTITVVGNTTPATTVLTIKGEVVPPATN